MRAEPLTSRVVWMLIPAVGSAVSGCGAPADATRGGDPPVAAARETQQEPMPPTPDEDGARPTVTSRPLAEWSSQSLAEGSIEARLPQEATTETLDDGESTVVWSEWDGAGFAIAIHAADSPIADTDLAQLAATSAAVVLDGLFGVERGTIAHTVLTSTGTPRDAPPRGDWTTRAVELQGTAMGKDFTVLCRAYRKDGQLVLHLLVAEPGQIENANAFFDTLVLR